MMLLQIRMQVRIINRYNFSDKNKHRITNNKCNNRYKMQVKHLFHHQLTLIYLSQDENQLNKSNLNLNNSCFHNSRHLKLKKFIVILLGVVVYKANNNNMQLIWIGMRMFKKQMFLQMNEQIGDQLFTVNKLNKIVGYCMEM